MIPLESKMLELLYQCLKSNKPELLRIIEDYEITTMDKLLVNELREVVADEFINHGLDANDEPNELGLQLEELINHLGRLIVT